MKRGQDDGRGEAAARRIRHRQWTWCRRRNGFSDKPLWRAVAVRLGMPVFQVVAFVNRLEEQANAATPRGYVGDFSPTEFAAALDMSSEDALRIYDALGHGDIQWISQEQVADFHDRNPDKEDVTNAERQRRHRARRKAAVADARKSLETNTESNGVTDRDTVTVTPREEHILITEAEPEQGQPGTEKGLEAGNWLDKEGAELVKDRMEWSDDKTKRSLDRWRSDLENDGTLKAIIEAADRTGLIGPRFHNLVTDQISRAKATAKNGPQLPLPPVIQIPRAMKA